MYNIPFLNQIPLFLHGFVLYEQNKGKLGLHVFPLKAETPEEERENRRRRSPLRNRSDLNESRYGYIIRDVLTRYEAHVHIVCLICFHPLLKFLVDMIVFSYC